ncbi:MAG TPA: hypothetical protein VHY91_09630 [Pirellulales bacterium]|nr:hypothetical protein [Pirellulales bacterium]
MPRRLGKIGTVPGGFVSTLWGGKGTWYNGKRWADQEQSGR